MKKYVIAALLLPAAALYLTGCSKVIDVKLTAAAPKLVIDASINWAKNTTGNEQRIYLSSTTGYYDEAFPTVSGASVTITNNTNTVFTFTETDNAGEYLCTNFTPVIGQAYHLAITLNQITYKATDTLLATPDIDTLIVQNDKGGFAGDELEIAYSFQDDGSRENYYMSRVKTKRVAYPVFDMESDLDYQGRKMTEFYSHEDLAKGDTADIKLYAVSRRFYDYFRKVLIASGGDSGPFPIIPGQARGNIINQNNANDFPLGYFRLGEVSAISYTLK